MKAYKRNFAGHTAYHTNPPSMERLKLSGNRAFSAWTAIVGEFYPKIQNVQGCLDKLYKFNQEYGEIIELWHQEKAVANFMDYEDFLIEAFSREIRVYDAKAAFIDEAQDLNRLEISLIQQITEPVERVFYAGDDDQAIYDWNGAKPDFFLNLEGEEIILPKTWRLPSVIWENAQAIIRNVRRRRNKEVEPTGAGGFFRVTTPMDIESVTIEVARFALKNQQQTVFLLFRTNHMVRTAHNVLINHGVPFSKLKGKSLWG